MRELPIGINSLELDRRALPLRSGGGGTDPVVSFYLPAC
jgi:hypothetical protein